MSIYIYLRTNLNERNLTCQYLQSGKISFACLFYHLCQSQLKQPSVPGPLYPFKQSLSKQHCTVCQQKKLLISYSASTINYLKSINFREDKFLRAQKDSISRRVIFANETFLIFNLSNNFSV